MIITTIAVAAGGAFGALVRYMVSERLNSDFPWGTFFVNMIGSFLLGLYITIGGPDVLNSMYAAGFLGALTTFSTLQFELVTLYKKDKRKVLYYLVLTYTLGLTAAWTGYLIAAKI
ncbi:fluoride efflux transporter FluC [Fictibacillus phosphorivorans]|uniref:fluoride efflux transporter FluC n=1 Tax=Fictibacillus phosphorivorans TaxID=1221500 RepID=UPI00204228A2|nr:CrcB family protein [Fictibacillus phosphorivorans]MCM3718592.1 CrcB family protein [Fictibacillus phosphorivorans]MCM3776215.1 CrcB family protein [Fictibacillus phosphorivorans]